MSAALFVSIMSAALFVSIMSAALFVSITTTLLIIHTILLDAKLFGYFPADGQGFAAEDVVGTTIARLLTDQLLTYPLADVLLIVANRLPVPYHCPINRLPLKHLKP